MGTPSRVKAIFPNYQWDRPTILQTAENIPAHIAVHIRCLQHDKVAACKDVRQIICQLQSKNKNVTVFELNDRTVKHGQLLQNQQFQKSVNRFYTENGIIS